MDRLTRAGAMAVYLDRYWRVLQADRLPRGLDLALFDAAVNLGCPTAVRLLQRVLRITDDGLVGPETLGAVKAFRPLSELLTQYSALRAHTYEALAAKSPEKYQKYMHGWRLRCYRVAVEAGRLCGNS